MQRKQIFVLGATVAVLAMGCTGNGGGNGGGGDSGNRGGRDGSVRPGDAAAPIPTMGGTCDTPIDLAMMGTRSGASVTFSGSTTDAQNILHPYDMGCAMQSDGQRVVRYHPPSGTQAFKVSTVSSTTDFDTVVYVRASCGQTAGAMDIACNNRQPSGEMGSTLFVTPVMDQDYFIVIGGTAAAMAPASGNFALTVTEVQLGTSGNPCRPMTDPPSMMPVCDASLVCSNAQLCVPPVATGQNCDPNGVMNACSAMGATCVTDPSPPAGTMMNPAVCAMPGTRAGAPCRMNAPRCDGPLVCGMGDNPVCVHVLAAGAECDPTGQSNQCPMGQRCVTMGDADAGTQMSMCR